MQKNLAVTMFCNFRWTVKLWSESIVTMSLFCYHGARQCDLGLSKSDSQVIEQSFFHLVLLL